MDKTKANVIHSLIWAVVAIVVFGGGWLTISYTISHSNDTSVKLKEIK